MIFDDLYRLYELKFNDKSPKVPPFGWLQEKIIWELCIDADGQLVSMISLNGDERPSKKHKKPSTRSFVWMDVPEQETRSGKTIKPYFLCDKAAYFFGLKGKKEAKEEREAARELHHRCLDDVDDPAARAVLAFFDRDYAGNFHEKVGSSDLIVFRFLPDNTLVHERKAVLESWNRYYRERLQEDSKNHPEIQCAVTGKCDKAAKLFPKIQIFGTKKEFGTTGSGAPLVSFNKESFCSYGKYGKGTEGKLLNASMGVTAAHGIGATLRYLVNWKNKHCVSFGGTQILFWTDGESQSDLEEIAAIFNQRDFEEEVGEDEKLQAELNARLLSIRAGKPSPEIHMDTRCFILGLSPNDGRLSIRFYEQDTLGKLDEHFASYLQDTEMVSCKDGASSLKPRSIGAYVRQTAVLGKPENVPSTLVASTMHAMICGKPFPMPLYLQLLERTKVDKGYSGSGTKTYDAMRLRVPMLKACLLRFARQRKDVELERSLTVALNEENTNAGYLLGRLFAVLEKAQRDALGKNINATIRDRYIGSASTTPARVFPQLLRLAQYHISKSEYGGVSDRLIERIASTMDGSEAAFPSTLSYDDQGQFFIGYYQQKASFFVKKDDDNNKED